MILMDTQDFENIPKGSVMEVLREGASNSFLQGYYQCLWGSMNGTHKVIVPKEITKPYEDKLKEILSLIKK